MADTRHGAGGAGQQIAKGLVVATGGGPGDAGDIHPVAAEIDDAGTELLVSEQPLHAQLLGAAVGHLGDDRLHNYLGTADVQLLDDGAVGGQLAVGADHDHGVGALFVFQADARAAGGGYYRPVLALCIARTFRGRHAFLAEPAQHLYHFARIGMAQVDDLGTAGAWCVLGAVELAQQAGDTFQVAAPVGNDQLVRRRIRCDHTDPWVDQGLENAQHLLAGGIAHVEYPRSHAVAAFPLLPSRLHRHRLQASSLVGNDLHAAVGQVDSGVALGAQLGQEDVVDGIGVVQVDGAYGDLALDPGVDDEGGAGDA